MPFPLIGWAAVAIGSAAIAYVMRSEDDTGQSSGVSNYKKSIAPELKKRDKARRKELKKSIALATTNMWKKQIKEALISNATILFSDDKESLVATKFSRKLLSNNYLVFILNEQHLKEIAQTVKSYIAIDGIISELNIPNSNFTHFMDRKLTKYSQGALTKQNFESIAIHLNIVGKDEVENEALFNVIAPLINFYEVQTSYNDIQDMLNKYQDYYGEREGLEEDNCYNPDIDGVITKIKSDFV